MPSPLKYRTVLLRCARLISDDFNEILLPYQLNYSLWQVLYLIQEHPAINSIDLAKLLNISKPSVAKRVQILMQLGFLQQVETHDKRQKKLILSKCGQSLFSECAEKIDSYERETLKDFDHFEIVQSFQTLNTLLEQLQNKKELRHE